MSSSVLVELNLPCETPQIELVVVLLPIDLHLVTVVKHVLVLSRLALLNLLVVDLSLIPTLLNTALSVLAEIDDLVLDLPDGEVSSLLVIFGLYCSTELLLTFKKLLKLFLLAIDFSLNKFLFSGLFSVLSSGVLC